MCQDVFHLRLAQSRRVIFERQLVLRFVHVEAPQAIGIRKFSEMAQLFIRQRGLQFVRDINECHVAIIPALLAGRLRTAVRRFDST